MSFEVLSISTPVGEEPRASDLERIIGSLRNTAELLQSYTGAAFADDDWPAGLYFPSIQSTGDIPTDIMQHIRALNTWFGQLSYHQISEEEHAFSIAACQSLADLLDNPDMVLALIKHQYQELFRGIHTLYDRDPAFWQESLEKRMRTTDVLYPDTPLDQRVLDAFRNTPRHAFIVHQPAIWDYALAESSAEELLALFYSDSIVPLNPLESLEWLNQTLDKLKDNTFEDTASGIQGSEDTVREILSYPQQSTTSQPSLIARILTELVRAHETKDKDPKDMTVYEIGSGSGYVLALLHTLGYGKVVGVEINESIGIASQHALSKHDGVSVIIGNGLTVDLSYIDAVIISAAIPEHHVEAILKNIPTGCILIAPHIVAWEESMLDDEERLRIALASRLGIPYHPMMLSIYEKMETGFKKTDITECRFVPMQ